MVFGKKKKEKQLSKTEEELINKQKKQKKIDMDTGSISDGIGEEPPVQEVKIDERMIKVKGHLQRLMAYAEKNESDVANMIEALKLITIYLESDTNIKGIEKILE